MSQFALIVGATSFGETGLPPRPESKENAHAIGQLWESLGIPETHRISLIGNQATRIGCESRLKKLCKLLQPNDSVWFYYSGYALSSDSQLSLICTDTNPEDIETTAWDLTPILNTLHATQAKTFALLDLGIPPGINWKWGGELGLSRARLEELFPPDGIESCLCANVEEGISFVNPESGLSIWTEMLILAISGAAEYPLTARRLHHYLEEEVPRCLRKQAEGKAKQTPGLFGAKDLMWLQSPPGDLPQTSSRIDATQLKRIVFRGLSRQRLKDLPNLPKGQKLPDQVTPYAQRWLAKVAEPQLKDEIEHLYNAVREEMGFKRKELEAGTTEDGYGYIRTPQFDYSVAISLDPDDVSLVIWRREVSHFTDASVLRSPSFRKVFGPHLDELTFDFLTPLEVEAVVDQIEERNPKGVKVRVAGDGASCEITIAGFKGMLKIDRKRLIICAGGTANPESLLEQFFRFQNEFQQTQTNHLTG